MTERENERGQDARKDKNEQESATSKQVKGFPISSWTRRRRRRGEDDDGDYAVCGLLPCRVPTGSY